MHACVMASRQHMQWSNVNFKREKKQQHSIDDNDRPTERTASVAATDEHVNGECVPKCNYCWIIATYAPLVFHSFSCTHHCRQLLRSENERKKPNNFLLAHSRNSFCIRYFAISFLSVVFFVCESIYGENCQRICANCSNSEIIIKKNQICLKLLKFTRSGVNSEK